MISHLAILAAEMNGSPADFYPWYWVGGIVVCAGVIIVVINQVDEFIKRRMPKQGTPPNEQLEATLKVLAEAVKTVTETNADQHKEMRAEILAVEKAAQKDLQQAIAQGNHTREKMQDGMNELNISVAKLTGTMETLNGYFK